MEPVKNLEKLICIRYPNNKIVRVPRSEAESLVVAGEAVFTTKSKYHEFLKNEGIRIRREHQKEIKLQANDRRLKSKGNRGASKAK